jgi:1A family penicillin-binding protein
MRPFIVLAFPAVLAAQQAPVEPWQIITPPQASIIFARDGSMIGEVGTQSRFSVPIASLPPYVGQAFVAIEDQRFYQHDGVDLVGVAAAIKDNLLGERRGASTITQQLVGNMHPDLINRRDMSLSRKLREQAAAREMEKHYSKDQILQGYLNQIEFGHGWLGVEMASRHYFGKGAAQLTLAEAATLAALPKGPAVYDPIRYPERVTARRNLVLSQMALQGYITADQAAQAKLERLVVAPSLGRSVSAPYFVDAIRQIGESYGILVGGGGYRVYTTLDPDLQAAAADALVKGVATVEASPGFRGPRMQALPPNSDQYLQGLIVALDPATGDVRAMVGGRDYARSSFNRATYALRQPGSSIKPFVYARALMDSIPANTLFVDSALSIPLPNGDVYSPENAEGDYVGPMTMREALVHSRNTVAVQVGLQVTMDSVAALAAASGIDTPILPYPSSAIGASAVRPVDFVAAYSVFATNGAAVDPRYILRIEDRGGRTVYTAPEPEPRPVLDPRVAFIVRDILRDVATRGTGAAARRIVPAQIPVAGKTGTTNDNADVWFVGFTPTLVAGVWLGFDKPRTIMPGAVGGTLAAPIWAATMAKYYASRSAGEFPAAPDMSFAELDRATGALADSSTTDDRRYMEYFLPGTEPTLLRVNPWKVPQWGPLITH